jgi:uncharacterized phage protein (TIGR02218 family)
MIGYPEELLAHLAGDVTTLCHCWKLTRGDGQVAGFTDHDRTLTFGGVVFEPEAGFSASEARDTLGLAVDTMEVEGALSSARISEEDIGEGLYDGAGFETYLVNWQRPEDHALIRRAAIGKIVRRDQRFVAELESPASALDQPRGRYVRRTCDAELGDARCGFDLDREGFSGSGTVTANAAPYAIDVSGLEDFETGWFGGGFLTWTGGVNDGRGARVVQHLAAGDGARLVLVPGRWSEPMAGDAFTLTAGCDKKFATCKAKFANQLNFRGFPHLPGNDAAYGYVTDGEIFDGGALVE